MCPPATKLTSKLINWMSSSLFKPDLLPPIPKSKFLVNPVQVSQFMCKWSLVCLNNLKAPIRLSFFFFFFLHPNKSNQIYQAIKGRDMQPTLKDQNGPLGLFNVRHFTTRICESMQVWDIGPQFRYTSSSDHVGIYATWF